MIKRLLTATPSEILQMSASELLESIRISEGRTLIVAARTRAANMIDFVSNAEVVAGFGADIINMDTFDVTNPYMPGWPSKDPSEDKEIYEYVQVPLGKGYGVKEIEETIGRPLGILMLVTEETDRADLERTYGNIVATPERIKHAADLGVKIIGIGGWCSHETVLKLFRETKAIVGDSVILQFDRPHGPGILNSDKKFIELVTEQQAVDFVEAGADIIGLPAPGAFPGWTVEKCKRYVDLIHEKGGLVCLGVHTSQEGAMVQTLEQIALYSKMAGADIHALGDSGNNEQIIDPLNILHFSIAIKGRRHTFRRMTMSIKR